MYNSQYYTCEQIDERLLQGYLDDYNTQTGQSLTKAQFLTKLGSIFSKEGVIDNTATQIGYYECDTAAGTAAKAITVANYALFAGGSMKVKFANKNTANNATLNINSQGAKALYYQGERASATNSWDAEEVVEIYYDGTSYYANNVKGGSGSGVYDVSKEHPTSGPNSDGKFTLEYILNSSNVNELIPVNKRYPRMTIQFVSTSDNKSVQYRLIADDWSTNTEDWAIANEGVYVENPEFVYVKADAEGKILLAIKTDGSVYYGAGVPQQVIDYIEEKYEDINTFLNDLEKGDKTLQTLLDEKVDKEEGKSLIDAEYANGVHYIESPEFIEVKLDADERILEATYKDGTKLLPAGVKVVGTVEYDGATIKTVENPEFACVWLDGENKILFGVEQDGNFLFGCGIPKQVKEYIEQKIEELSLDEYESVVSFIGEYLNNTTLEELLSKKVDGEYVDNPEFIEIKIDAEGKVLEGIQKNGTKVIGGDIKVLGKMEVAGVTYKVVENPEFIEAKTDSEGKVLAGRTPDGAAFETVGFSTPKASIGNHIIKNIEDPEGRSEITTDSENKIISYRDTNGVKHENVGIESKNITASEINTEKISGLTDEGLTELEQALKAHGFTGGQGDWSDYISNDGSSPLHLAIPRCAIVNLMTDYDLTQLSKAGYTANPPYWPAGVEGVTYDIPITVQFWDMQGNYFKKKAIIGGQGSSTMTHNKKNIAVDFFDSEWGEDAFSIKFGNWVPQDSFHMKAYDYEAFVGVGMWAYRLYDNILKTKGVENDYVWKNALLNYALNTTTSAYGTNVVDSSAMFDDTGAKCFPDGFPVIIFQNGEFWGVFSWQLKKHRDNYKMDKSNPEHIHLDGNLGTDDLWGANGDGSNIDWSNYGFEVRNPKNLVYASKQNNSWKYDADIAMAEIAGNNDGSRTYDTWVAGSYNEGKIVEHNGHYFLNTVAGNTLEPVYHNKNNSDSSPDFKNKTGCGWLNVTNTIKVKESIIAVSTVMPAIKVKEDIYTANPTAENLNALKAEFEKTFNVSNLVDYIIINDVVRNDDAFRRNWQWTTYDGVKWWCNLYDTNIAFGYTGGTENIFRPTLTAHLSDEIMLHYILTYYTTELNARWKELRDLGVIDGANIFNIAKEWIDAIGLDNFALENKKWLSVKCRDNMFRIKKWIDANIAGLDTAYNYN